MRAAGLVVTLTVATSCDYAADIRDCRVGCTAASVCLACMNFGDPIVDLAVFQPATADAYIDAGGLPSHVNDIDLGAPPLEHERTCFQNRPARGS